MMLIVLFLVLFALLSISLGKEDAHWGGSFNRRLDTVKRGIDSTKAVIIADVQTPHLVSFNATYILAVYDGAQCILEISNHDYVAYGLKPQYMTVLTSALKQDMNHISFTFSTGAITVLAENGALEVSFNQGETFDISDTLFQGVSAIFFFNETSLAFSVLNQTMFDVPWFHLTVEEALQINLRPTGAPSSKPSKSPTVLPTVTPTTPTGLPTSIPTGMPTIYPTMKPTHKPSTSPSASPSAYPSATPSRIPSAVPTASPSASPSKARTGVCGYKCDHSYPGNLGNNFICPVGQYVTAITIAHQNVCAMGIKIECSGNASGQFGDFSVLSDTVVNPVGFNALNNRGGVILDALCIPNQAPAQSEVCYGNVGGGAYNQSSCAGGRRVVGVYGLSGGIASLIIYFFDSV